jgi:glycosyltransferase involved in cell wall biosynthesis
MTCAKDISVIIPARNEAACLGDTVSAILESTAFLRGLPGMGREHLAQSPVEVLVVDNRSTDHTVEVVGQYAKGYGVTCVSCSRLGAACARNYGVRHALGSIYVFVDADTRIPLAGLRRISDLVRGGGFLAGIFPLTGNPDTWSSACWWGFWNLVRRLPLARAKALPAFMFCTREVFDRFGPFDERVQIGEEWPILAGLYRRYPQRFVYDRSLRATTSNRRMTLQPHGYAKTFIKYLWAVLHSSGRNGYPDTFREQSGARVAQYADDPEGAGAGGTPGPAPARKRANPGHRLRNRSQRRVPSPPLAGSRIGG